MPQLRKAGHPWSPRLRPCVLPKHPVPVVQFETTYAADEVEGGLVLVNTLAARPNIVLRNRRAVPCQVVDLQGREVATEGLSRPYHLSLIHI